MNGEEIRKIQVTGKSTYIVSLPKRWATEMKLKAGDGILIKKQEDSSLLIIPKGLKELKKVEEVEVGFSPEDDPYAMARKIVSLYLIGYNLIRMVAEERISAEQREIIRQFVRKKLMGTEIISDSPNEMTIQVLLSHPELSVLGALRRMSTVAASMWMDAMKALEKLDLTLAKDVIEMDDEVDRFSMYIIRQLKSAVGDLRLVREIGLNTARDCLGCRLITKSVERIADHAALIAEKILRLKKPVKKNLLKKMVAMSAFAGSMFENAVQSLFKLDYKLAEEVIKKREIIGSLENEVIRLIPKKEFPRDAINLRLIAESLRRVAEYSTDISEIVLNLTVTTAIKK